jgi:hypothetical protein
MSCKYKNNGRCELLTAVCDPRGFHVPESFCVRECSAVDISKQKQTLKRFGAELPDPPEGTDLLEWAKECVANGTVKLPPQAEAIQKQKAEQAKAMAELPSWFQQAKNLHKHAKQILDHWNQTGKILVSPEQKAERLAICDDCEKLWENKKTGNKRCSGCGCHLSEVAGVELGKADFEALTCENWPKI